MSKKVTYCSLDIESTGLDAEKDHIIEVGAVLFEVGKDGEIKFGKEFSELVKPPIEIPKFIQNLTSIRTSDVEDAPTWEEVSPRFKKFVRDYPIVGQNVGFDLKFIASRGLEFSNDIIDTQTLARVFVPHSKYFNLDYLHTHFGLQIESHHRALADSKSASVILGKIINSFHDLPLNSQKQIIKLLKTSSLVYKDLFKTETTVSSDKKSIDAEIVGQKTKKETKETAVQAELFERLDNTDILAPLQENIDFKDALEAKGTNFFALPASLMKQDTLEQLAEKVISSSDPALLAVASEDELNAFRKNPHWLVLESPENYFCETRLTQILQLPDLPDDLVQFLIKVLVWKANGMENFSGLPMTSEERLYRKLICGSLTTCKNHKKNEDCIFAEILSRLPKSKGVALLHKAIPEYGEILVGSKNLRSFFWNASALLYALEKESASILTLKKVRSVLQVLAQPGSDKGFFSGHKVLKEKVANLLNQIDLDFGLLGIELLQAPFAVGTRMVDDELRDSYSFVKLEQVFTKLTEALQGIEKEARKFLKKGQNMFGVTNLLTNFAKFFKDFFIEPSPNSLYWFDTFGSEIKLGKRPRKLSLENFVPSAARSFFAPFSTEEVASHMRGQFGLDSVETKMLVSPTVRSEIILPEENASAITDAKLVELLKKIKERTLVLFNSQRALDAAYAHLEKNKLNKNMLVQRHTGHHWKNEEAYNKNAGSIWFLTVHNFLKLVHTLPLTRNLILTKIPYAISDSSAATFDQDEVFEKFVMPRTSLRLERIFSLFLNSAQEGGSAQKFVMLDSRINLDYNQAILDSITASLGGEVERFLDEVALEEKIST